VCQVLACLYTCAWRATLLFPFMLLLLHLLYTGLFMEFPFPVLLYSLLGSAWATADWNYQAFYLQTLEPCLPYTTFFLLLEVGSL
jgi:hypothetical protein